jgi:hypothetical protein
MVCHQNWSDLQKNSDSILAAIPTARDSAWPTLLICNLRAGLPEVA